MDIKEIQRWWEVFKSWEDDPITEIRILDGKRTYSGYFRDVQSIIERIAPYDNCAIYFTLNPVTSGCDGRSQFGKIIQSKTTTSGENIVKRNWILIDFDPVRLSDTSASDTEKARARILANKVYTYLKLWGFPAPVSADSGNGYHLLYRVDMTNTPAATELVSSFLKSIATMFGDGFVDIDTQVCDPNRICKLYGSMARKGANTETRPHRLSHIVKVPDVLKIVDADLIRKVADMLPKEEKPTYSNNYGRDRFDIDGFIQKYGIEIQKEIRQTDGTRKLILKECPFDSNHKAPDAALFVMPSGAVGFKCFHNSCSGHDWKAFRTLFEPDAYSRRYDYSRTNKPPKSPSKTQIQPQKITDKPEWYDFAEIEQIDKDKLVYVPSGIEDFDKAVRGFCLGENTIWSGSNASGKSSLLNTLSLNAVQAGYKVAIWSGELPAPRLKQWIQLAAAGNGNTIQSDYGSNFYFVDKKYIPAIDSWLSGKLFIYNNDYGNKWDMILESIRKKVTEEGISVVVVDNLMALDIDAGAKELENQKMFVLGVRDLVRELNIHCHLVCHPRKTVTFLRKTDIAGSADLANAIDNIIIVHRNNQDFKRGIDEYYPKGTADRFGKYGNIMEVCKSRFGSTQDELIGLYFDVTSKRMYGDSTSVQLQYSWDKSADRIKQQELEFEQQRRNEEIENFEKDGDLPPE